MAIAVGIALERAVPWLGVEAVAAGVALALLAALAARFAARLRTFCVLLALVPAGLLLALWHEPKAAPVIESGPEESVLLEGCVVEPTLFYEGRDQFTLELAPGARAHVNLTLRDGEPAPDLRYGQRVEIEAKVRRPHNFENPGEFDYVGFLAREHVYWNAAMQTGSTPKLLPGRCGGRAAAVIYGIREAAFARLERLYSNDALARGLLEAILLGERRKLDKVWQDDFRRAGTYHVLVVAGLHLAAFAGFLLFLLRVCFVREIPALAITTAAAWMYACVSGGATPALRAAGALTLYLVARYFSRRTRVLNLIAAVALVFLIADPAQLFEPAFQLSFLAVASIGALGIPLIERTSGRFAMAAQGIEEVSRDPHLPPDAAALRVEIRLLAETLHLYTRLPRLWWERGLARIVQVIFAIYELALISTTLQIGLALPMAIYFHRVSLYGITANVLVVPMMPLVVPVGLMAVITGWHPLARSAAWLVETAARVSVWHAHAAPDWRIPDPPLWVDVSFVAALVALALVLGAKLFAGKRRWTMTAGIAVAALFALILWHPFQPVLKRGRLEVTAIDVGQGDSLFVAFPGGHTMLIDGGGIPTFGREAKSRLDIGEDVVAPYLWSRSLRSIDILAMTHAHADHAGGLGALMDDFHPREFWTGANSDNPAWRELRDHARRLGIRVRELRAGACFTFDGATVTVLAPAADYSAAAAPNNNDSLVLRLAYGERSFLLTGDAETPVETRMVADGLAHADVLKVGHHGSKTSTTETFLDAVRPAFAIVSDGRDNRFHHPHPSVVARLNEHHAEVLRTDTVGLISVSTDGRRLWVRDFSEDSAGKTLPP